MQYLYFDSNYSKSNRFYVVVVAHIYVNLLRLSLFLRNCFTKFDAYVCH